MRSVIANTIIEGLTQLGISESSYYRWRSQGRAFDEIVMIVARPMVKIVVLDGKRGHHNEGCVTMDAKFSGRDALPAPRGAKQIEPPHGAPNIESFFGHKKYLKGWIEWRDSGIGQKVWSKVYRHHQIRYANRFFKQFDVISSENLRTWLNELPPSSQSGRSDRYCFVVSMAKYLYKELNILPEDEHARIKAMYPGKTPDYEPKQHIIYDEDLELIFAKLPVYYAEKPYHGLLIKTMITLLAETGIRISELASLSRENMNFSDNPQRAFIKVKGKGSKTRKVPFSRAAQADIREYLANKPEEAGNDSLFSVYHYHKKQYTPFQDNWLKHELKFLSDFIGIRFTAHSFRHYRITKWANNPRIPITSTQLWAGHNQLTVTQNYIHIRDDDALIAAFG